MQISNHQHQNEFIERLRLTPLKSDRGLFILNINDISEDALESMALYRNEFYEVNLISGQYNFRFTIDDVTYHPQGEAYAAFVAPSQLQTYEVLGEDDDAKGYVIYISKKLFSEINPGEYFPFFKRDYECLFTLNEDQSDQLFHLARQMEYEFKGEGEYRKDIAGGFVRIFFMKMMEFFQPEPSDRGYAQQVLARFESLVNQHYIHQKSVQFYAGELAISVRQLSSLTQKTIGKSPLQLIHDIVINESKALLTQSQMSASEIAYQLGFEEVAHFSRFFKKKVHLAPSEYRMTEMGKTIS